MRLLYFLTVISLILTSCSRREETSEKPGTPLEVKYAKAFSLYETSEGILLEVTRPFPGAELPVTYLFTDSENIDSDHRVIQVPAKTIVCTSTTHIPMIEYLGELDRVVGFPTTDYISSEKARERIDNGSIVDLGSVLEMNIEGLLELNPDLLVNYSMDDLKKSQRLESLGLNVLLNADYLEDHPLGRTEWIKVFGLIFGKYQMADSIFQSIEKKYLEAKETSSAARNPCAFSGSMYGDAWFMPGSNNYAAKLLSDAGFEYVLKSDSSYGFVQWGYENVYQLASECEYWLSPAPFVNLEDLGNADERYKEFRAFQKGNVYVYDKQLGETGGNQYLELGYLRPDIILKDLISIRDSSSIPGYELYFYRKLE